MEFVFNDYSLNGQFEDIEGFLEWFHHELKHILNYSIDKKIPLLKKSDFYSRKITKDKTLSDVLQINGDPLVSQIKSYIIKMAFTEPYWDLDIKTQSSIDYKCPYCDDIPNCFTEAVERGQVLLSVKNQEFQDGQIAFQRGGVGGFINNFSTYMHFLKWLLIQGDSDKRYIFENFRYGEKVSFPIVNGRCYAVEAIENNELNGKDKQIILEGITRMLEGLKKGEKNRFWDSFGNGIFEYRVSVSEGREFRLLFFQNEGIYFLNGFIKKTQETPRRVIEKAVELKKEIERIDRN